MDPKHGEYIELLARIDERVGALHAEVCGENAQPGLKHRVASLELWRSGLVAVYLALIIYLTVIGPALGSFKPQAAPPQHAAQIVQAK